MSAELLQVIGEVVIQQPPIDYRAALVCLALGTTAAIVAGYSLRGLYRDLGQSEAIEEFIQPPNKTTNS